VMKIILTLFIFFTVLYGAKPVELSSKYESARKCKTCHAIMFNDWSTSWHAKSHYEKDEFFRKSIDFIAKKRRKSANIVKVECAKCHNPRISVTNVSDEYYAIAALGLDEGTNLDKAVKDKKISEGINCLVCHNIDKIHQDAPSDVRGMDRVEWTKNGVMSGPFKDAQSPYHKTQYRSFFDKEPNKLCFVCHANEHSVASDKLTFGNLQKEYKGSKKCVDCHMSEKIPAHATTYRFNGKDAKKRMIRRHFFAGAHKEKMWKEALKLKLSKQDRHLLIEIFNPQPHNIPTGCGSRELLIEVKLTDETGKIITKEVSLTTHYTRRRSRASIPHIAIKQTKDLSVPAQGKKVIKVTIPPLAKTAEVTLYYRLVNEEVANLLHLQEPIWKEKFFINSAKLRL